MLGYRKLTAVVTQVALIAAFAVTGAAGTNGGRDLIKTEDLKEYLGYLASDDLEGRDTFSEGLGLAAAYIATHLKSWGVKPGGPNGSYFQRLPVHGVKSENRSTLTVEVNGQSRTFRNGEGISFPPFVGGKRSFTAEQVEFVGYGLSAAFAGHDDYAGRDVRGKVAVWLGGLRGPKGLDETARRLLLGRARAATEQQGAIASIGAAINWRPASAGGAGEERPDFTTANKLDAAIAPAVSAEDAFYEFLFSGSEVKYAQLKALAEQGEKLPGFTLKNVRMTFNLDADYRVLRTQYTRNVVGIVEGSDPRLKNTYVAFGAHYDHVGYSDAEIRDGRLTRGRGRIGAGGETDRIWNGADDDGSGTVAIMAIAKAFAQGPKPKRSLLFVWHAGEERGLWGSRYFADHPTVPLEQIVAQVNMDMVGRDFNNRPDAANMVFVVGSDRISTELHNMTIEANEALGKPLRLDFSMNDPGDPEQIYYRSDHYSYAAKGIPVVFLFTGIHPDYHANTDEVDRINWEKMTRIAQFAYEIGARVANQEKPPARDNRGPRVGRTRSGKL